MKELITAEMVREMAAKSLKQIFVSSNTIMTHAARDQAAELGLEVVEGVSAASASEGKDLKGIRDAVVQCLKDEFKDQPLNEETVRTIVKRVIDRLGCG
ncbi:MAG: hypothetical protein FJ110_01825 [Deltaproteobacteria bacterium]|nr:hypothetical protein [Deltaproteobacteria bacterium]